MRIRIRGRYYTLHFRRPMTRCYGHFDPNTKEVVVSPRLRSEHRLEIIIHECTHAALPDLDEAAVTEYAADLAKVLWKLGYRADK